MYFTRQPHVDTASQQHLHNSTQNTRHLLPFLWVNHCVILGVMSIGRDGGVPFTSNNYSVIIRILFTPMKMVLFSRERRENYTII